LSNSAIDSDNSIKNANFTHPVLIAR